MAEQISLAQTTRELVELTAARKLHEEISAREAARLSAEILKRQTIISQSECGFDPDKIALAKTVLAVTDYSLGGQDCNSARPDAIRQIATGEPIRQHYGDLWCVAFATKNYDGWRGQRSDHEYGYGPRHGSTCFSIGFRPDVRKRDPKVLTESEVEACVYYLTHLEKIQIAEKAARTVAA